VTQRSLSGLFVPCYVDELWPQAGIAALHVMEALGVRPKVADPVCCGQVFSNAGARGDAEEVEAVFWKGHADLDEVVILSASCCGHLRRKPRKGPRVLEFSEWVLEHAPSSFPRPVERQVVVHHSCSSERETRSSAATREVLLRVEGLRVLEPSGLQDCCGFGGSFAETLPELSVKMGVDRMEHLSSASAEGEQGLEVVSADCSCLLHLAGVAEEGVRFRHVAEILEEALR